ncbi:hypothetical protein M0R45_008820 [Rubus argutus]|uniref:Ubiquitin-like protease family profile domain-containing protein n=1 Tax=Rubus argutus TaxID=59490 RepID=A0AAW1Y2U8_RUBAR
MQGNKRQQQKSFKADKHNNVWERKAIKSGGGSDIDTITLSTDRKRKNEIESVDKKDNAEVALDDNVEVRHGLTVQDPFTTLATVTISTATRLKEFKRTVSSLSNEKIIAILEMGFGPIYQFRCSSLNLVLCQTLVDNFDVCNSRIKIHGRQLSITKVDFQRVMGVRDGGCDVDLRGSMDHPEIEVMRKKIFGKSTELNIDVLRKHVVDSRTADDTFKICFSLYAMATLLCPTTPGHVDPSYLVAVRDPNALHLNNWASFCFNRLVEGISMFQRRRHTYIGGCLVFLQLFYLDVVAYSLCIVQKSVPPVLTWGTKEAKMVYDRVEENRGFQSESIYVTKRLSGGRTESTTSGFVDVSTGIRTNFWEDLTEVKSDVCAVKSEVDILRSSVREMKPDIMFLRTAISTLEESLGLLKSLGVGHLVSTMLKSVLAADSNVPLERMQEDLNGDHQYEADTPETKIRMSVNEPPMKDEARSSMNQRKEYLQTKQHGTGVFSIVGDISEIDTTLLKYMFSKKINPNDGNMSIDEVARHGEFSVSRWDICCLSPRHPLNRKVIDISASYLYETESDRWFLPAFFPDVLQRQEVYEDEQSWLSLLETLCIERNYHERLHRCTQIFIPINDTLDDHWFLLVISMGDVDCEIWDCKPAPQADERRKDYASAAMKLVEKVFANEMRMTMPFNSPSFTILDPCSVHSLLDHHDSGIFVIRNMQHYLNQWYEGFNSADQRVRLALEIVRNPKNEVIDRVLFAAASDEAAQQPPEGKLQNDGREVQLDCQPMFTQGIKFTARHPRR